jgi:hypothetical protein
MDPVTLGVAAAALLISKFGEGFAKDAGSAAWSGLSRLHELVISKFRGNPEAKRALELATASPPQDDVSRSALAEQITAAAVDDPRFYDSLAELVQEARRDPAAQTVIAQATGHAKQVNIAGDNHGGITL